MEFEKHIIIGGEEWCAFPELNIPAIKARVDSGARTSAIHAQKHSEVYAERRKVGSVSRFIPFRIAAGLRFAANLKSLITEA